MPFRFNSLASCLLMGFIGLFTNLAYASFPLPPRLSALAYASDYTVGQADLMFPLSGNATHNLYVDPALSYGSDNQNEADIGVGYRWIANDAAILGWYLFAGHTRVENNSGFWITNPGLEVMGRRWDAHVNAYIPIAKRSNEVANVDYNIVSEPFFTGHTEVIVSEFNVANEIQQIGTGADARVGYQFFRTVPLKGYLGAYFFSIANTNNVRGGAAGMEYWFNDTIRVFASYSYDNYQHSKVAGGLGISFGGVRKGHWADPSLSERLMDPVERYLANLGHGSGIPSKTLLYGMGSGSSTQLISSDIAFFSEGGTPDDGGGSLTLANCTFENPCGPTDFTQTAVTTLNGLLPNTQFYFNGGTYTSNGAVSLVSGQSVRSRTADYSQPATGAARSTITISSTLRLNGNNTLENIILLPTAAFNQPLLQALTTNNVITGSQIGSSSNRPTNGVTMNNTGSNTIDNTDIFSVQVGLRLTGGNTTIQNSQISVVGNASSGIIAREITLSLNNVQIAVTGVNKTGLRAVFGAVINASDTTILLNSSTGPSFGLATASLGVINFMGGTISVAGTPASIRSGTNITISGGTVCRTNGTTVVCP